MTSGTRSEGQSALRDDPANLTPKTAICRQDLALQSAAPSEQRIRARIYRPWWSRWRLLSSPHNARLFSRRVALSSGFTRTTRAPSSSSDPFAPVTTGMRCSPLAILGPGSRSVRNRTSSALSSRVKDRIGIILEPLNNWAGVSEALGAKRITVGGTLGLNPLELRQTPDHVSERWVRREPVQRRSSMMR